MSVSVKELHACVVPISNGVEDIDAKSFPVIIQPVQFNTICSSNDLRYLVGKSTSQKGKSEMEESKTLIWYKVKFQISGNLK